MNSRIPSQANLYRARAILRGLRAWHAEMAYDLGKSGSDNDGAIGYHHGNAEELSAVIKSLGNNHSLDMWARCQQSAGRNEDIFKREYDVRVMPTELEPT